MFPELVDMLRELVKDPVGMAKHEQLVQVDSQWRSMWVIDPVVSQDLDQHLLDTQVTRQALVRRDVRKRERRIWALRLRIR